MLKSSTHSSIFSFSCSEMGAGAKTTRAFGSSGSNNGLLGPLNLRPRNLPDRG